MAEAVRQHPWNETFEWEPSRGPFRRITEAQARDYDERGFFVLPDAFTPDEVSEIRTEIDGYEEQATEWLREQGGSVMIADADAITFTVHLVKRSELLRRICSTGVLAELASDLLGPDVNLYWDQAVYKKPERPRRFPWHQDNGYAFLDPQQYLTCWIALTDATLRNGCPQVAPGLHRMGTLAHRYVDPLGFECLSDPADVVVAEVPAGGVVVFSSLTPHLTGPNTTGDVRKAYIVQYAPAGAEVLRGDPTAGQPSHRAQCNDPDRQYAVLRDGGPVPG